GRLRQIRIESRFGSTKQLLKVRSVLSVHVGNGTHQSSAEETKSLLIVGPEFGQALAIGFATFGCDQQFNRSLCFLALKVATSCIEGTKQAGWMRVFIFPNVGCGRQAF